MAESFWLEAAGEEPEVFADYGDAVAALNGWADELAAAEWSVDRGWASRDNLHAVCATAPGSEVRVGHITHDDNDPTWGFELR